MIFCNTSWTCSDALFARCGVWSGEENLGVVAADGSISSLSGLRDFAPPVQLGLTRLPNFSSQVTAWNAVSGAPLTEVAGA